MLHLVKESYLKQQHRRVAETICKKVNAHITIALLMQLSQRETNRHSHRKKIEERQN